MAGRTRTATQANAAASIGAVHLRPDGTLPLPRRPTSHWESVSGAAARDHYRLRICSGTGRVTLEEDPSISERPVPPTSPQQAAGVAQALNVVLDGVASRSRPRSDS